MLASGTPFQPVILYGVNGQGRTIVADTFKLAAAKSDTIDAVSGAHAITPEYGGLGTANILVANPAKAIAGPAAGFATIQGTVGTDIITASGLFDTLDANGGNDVINAGSGFARVYTGNNSVLLDGYGNSIVLGNGTDTISAGSGFDRVVTGGGSDTVTLGGFGNTVTLNGSSASVSGGRGLDLVTVNGGTDTLTFAGVSDRAIVNGSANVAILDQGQGLRIDIGSSTLTDTIRGSAADRSALLHLKNHAGGDASTAAVLQALTTDGHGGTMLALGTTGSIDLLGTPTSALHAVNFKIGQHPPAGPKRRVASRSSASVG